MIECGFEFEFGHDVSLDLIKQLIKLHYPKNKIYTITDDSYNDVIFSKKYFIFKEDASVVVRNCKNISTEMVTPVFSGKKEILLNFKRMFEILKILNVKTNYTCSIHINIGFSEKEEIRKINLGKLYVYLNERKVLKLFKRSNNIHCKPCISKETCKYVLYLSNRNIIKEFEKILLFLEKNHKQSIAFDKCKNGEVSIIEFRFIGGDYINNFDDTYFILNKVIDSMYFSIGKHNKIKLNKTIKEFKDFFKENQ